jgi:hypothetical protein
MPNFPKFISASIALLMCVAVNSARAESTGWITPNELEKVSKEMRSKGMMPVKVACRGDSSSSNVRDSMQINMEWQPNREKRHWHWIWGDQFGRLKHDLEKKGWKLASSSGFTRPKTGLAVRCGIFHGK